jgi:hypothetical protein
MNPPLHSVPSARTVMTDNDYRALMCLFGFHDVALFRAFVAQQQHAHDRRAK